MLFKSRPKPVIASRGSNLPTVRVEVLDRVWVHSSFPKFEKYIQTVSDTLGESIILKVFTIQSGYTSRILEIRSVPIPDPVPPPKLWVSWNPWRQSQVSASFRTTSRTESTSSAPEN